MDFINDNYPEYTFSLRLIAGIKDLERLKQMEKDDNIVMLNPRYVKLSNKDNNCLPDPVGNS
jgi:hypothetical protein